MVFNDFVELSGKERWVWSAEGRRGSIGAVCGVGECANRFCEKAESSNCSSLEPGGRIAGKVTRGVYGLGKLRAGRKDKTIRPS